MLCLFSANPGTVNGNSLSETQKLALLQLHNAFRSMVQPSAANMLKMEWDDDLEGIASDFASKCIVAHNPDRHKAAKKFDWVGENIAWGTGTCGDKDCGDVYEGVKRWFTESKSYDYKSGECSGKCTLYTQMAWWESNKLGCGARKCGDRTILVCNYAPGGNYVGQRPYTSGSPCSKCPGKMICEDNLCINKKQIVPASLPVTTQIPVTTPLRTVQPCQMGVTCPVVCPSGVTCPARHAPCMGMNCAACPNGMCPTGMPAVTSFGGPLVSRSKFTNLPCKVAFTR